MTRVTRWLLIAAALLAGGVAHATPYRPASDAVVLEELPPALLALRQLRGAASPPPANPSLDDAMAAAKRYIELGQTYADPRAYGYAQAALGPWWSRKTGATPELLIMRARILQFSHRFPDALAQLKVAIDADQFIAEAWLLLASIEQVQGNIPAARAACIKLVPIGDPLVTATCAAATASLSGHAAQGEPLLARALGQPTGSDASVRVWAWTTLAEIRARLGDAAEAEAAFREALALQPADVYARAAYADLLLDDGRNADARKVLGDFAQADALLLRAAIAAQRNGDADAGELRANLAARFAEARERGDETHLREQARFALDVDKDAPGALALATRNFNVQREPADARLVLEAALAAGDPNAAKPVLDWIKTSGIDAEPLRALVRKIDRGGGA